MILTRKEGVETRIIVSTSANGHGAQLRALAEEKQAIYLPSVPAYEFPGTRTVIAALYEIYKDSPGCFSPEFAMLVNKWRAVQARQQQEENELPATLYPFQRKDVLQMRQMTRNILLASDMGTGKSVVAAVYLKLMPQLIPCILVCPASLKYNWEIELQRWAPQYSVYIVSGQTSYKDKDVLRHVMQTDIVIFNYDILAYSDKKAEKAETDRVKAVQTEGGRTRRQVIPVLGWVDKLRRRKFNGLVLDECQAIQTGKTIRARAVSQLSDALPLKKLFMSGTPFETKPKQFYTALHMLAPDIFPDEYAFYYRYCDPKNNGFGWTFDGATNVPELRLKLSAIMIRHRMEEVLPELPQVCRNVIYLDIEKKLRSEYDELEPTMLDSKQDSIHILAILAQLKKLLIMIKLKPVIQFIKDMLDVEDKLVVFCYHREMFEQLMEVFGNTAVGINGDVKTLDRQKAVDSFQNNDKTKLFIGQIKAAGTGITLTKAKVCVFVEFSQTVGEHQQAECRIRRIGQTASSCICYYLIVKDTVDEDAMVPLEHHAKDIAAVMDGNMDTQLFDLNSATVIRCRERLLMKRKKAVSLEYETL